MAQTRTIDSYIFPLDSSATPYNNSDFSPEVRQQCTDEFKTMQMVTAAAEANANTPNAKIRNQPSIQNRLRVAKCIVVGDIAVGKTCLINRFGYNVYANDYKATIGVDFDVQKFEVLKRPFSLQIWDTAGQDRFRIITRSYYRGAHVALIVFDLTNMASFLNVRCWLKEIMDTISPENSGAEMPFLFLVGSKKDLLTPDTLNFFQTEGSKLANEIGAEFWMISSQTGENVQQLFERISCLSFNELVLKELKEAEESKMPLNGNVRYLNRNSGLVILSVPNGKQSLATNGNGSNGVSALAHNNNNHGDSPNSQYYNRNNDSLCGRITNRLFYKFRKHHNHNGHHRSSNAVAPQYVDSNNTNPFEMGNSADSLPQKKPFKKRKKAFSCFNLNCVVSLN